MKPPPESLLPEEHITVAFDWAESFAAIPAKLVTVRSAVLFYCAVHLIQAVAKTEGHNGGHRIHKQRDDFMIEKHPREYRHYNELYDWGSKGRYNPHLLDRYTPAHLEEQLLKKHFKAIAMMTEKMTGDEGLANDIMTRALGITEPASAQA